MVKLAHIINPVVVNEGSDLYIAQPVTFESIRKARDYSVSEVVDVYCACYVEDESLVPDDFMKTTLLERSVLDLADFRQARKLPLVRDILDRLYTASNADYFIYTNVDIAVMPYFYKTITDIIDKGHDAFVINRRTIRPESSSVTDIHLMYAEAGDIHRGYDCFVFKRSKYPEYRLGNSCIGAKWVGKVIIANMICNAVDFRLFTNLHLTFHLGNDRHWANNQLSDYEEFNRKELSEILGYYECHQAFSHELIRDMVDEIAVKSQSRTDWLLNRAKKIINPGRYKHRP